MNKNETNDSFTCSRRERNEELVKSDSPPSREGLSRG